MTVHVVGGEVVTAVCLRVLQKFTLELEEGFEPHYAPSVTLPMRDGLRVRVKRR